MNDPTPLLVYSYLRYSEGISLDKRAAEKQALNPAVIGALAGGTIGLTRAAFSGRRDRDGNRDRPWIRDTMIGAGLGGLAGYGYDQYFGQAPEDAVSEEVTAQSPLVEHFNNNTPQHPLTPREESLAAVEGESPLVSMFNSQEPQHPLGPGIGRFGGSEEELRAEVGVEPVSDDTPPSQVYNRSPEPEYSASQATPSRFTNPTQPLRNPVAPEGAGLSVDAPVPPFDTGAPEIGRFTGGDREISDFGPSEARQFELAPQMQQLNQIATLAGVNLKDREAMTLQAEGGQGISRPQQAVAQLGLQLLGPEIKNPELPSGWSNFGGGIADAGRTIVSPFVSVANAAKETMGLPASLLGRWNAKGEGNRMQANLANAQKELTRASTLEKEEELMAQIKALTEMMTSQRQ